MRSAAEEEKEKSLKLLGGILSKLLAFCEKTRIVHKEHKYGAPPALNIFRQVKAGRGRRLTAQAPKACLSAGLHGRDYVSHGGGASCVHRRRHGHSVLMACTRAAPARATADVTITEDAAAETPAATPETGAKAAAATEAAENGEPNEKGAAVDTAAAAATTTEAAKTGQ